MTTRWGIKSSAWLEVESSPLWATEERARRWVKLYTCTDVSQPWTELYRDDGNGWVMVERVEAERKGPVRDLGSNSIEWGCSPVNGGKPISMRGRDEALRFARLYPGSVVCQREVGRWRIVELSAPGSPRTGKIRYAAELRREAHELGAAGFGNPEAEPLARAENLRAAADRPDGSGS